MSEMVEKVARALHEAHKPWCDWTYPFEHPQSSREVYEALATAALEAVDLRVAFVEACNTHLREEVKRLTDGFFAARANSDDYIRKNEVLRAENERLEYENRALKAGQELQLRALADKRVEDLKAENERLIAEAMDESRTNHLLLEELELLRARVSDEHRDGEDREAG